MKKKQIKLGLTVRAIAGKNPKFGKAIDKLPHHSAARAKMARKGK